jgi:paraquat-inducible protein B
MSLLGVRDLRLQYGPTLIQEGIDFDIEPGTIYAVMGGSGCGKSTLLKCLIGLLEPAAGQVLYREQDYWASNEATRNQLRADIGVLFQSAALWSSMTVLENVMLPLQVQGTLPKDQHEARALEALEWVGMAEARDRLPADLSGGMKKRVGLARAIVARPHLLFLDEPSAGLDPISSVKLDRLILGHPRAHGGGHRHRHARAAQHLCARRRRHLSGCRPQTPDCPWQTHADARHCHAPHGAGLHAQTGDRHPMKRHAFLVGAFVLLALVLVVAGVLTLNKSGWFTPRHQAVIYFDDSVKGLYIGAPVTFRGVKMGEVTRIGVEVNQQTLVARIPVTLTLGTESLQMDSGSGQTQTLDLSELVKRGLRARLILQSVVTGQTAIELDFRPDLPGRLLAGGKSPIPEIPTMQDKLDALINQVQDLPLGEMVAELRQTMRTLNDTLKSSQVAIDKTSQQLNATGVQARQTLVTADEALKAVQAQTTLTLQSLQQLTDTTRGTVTQMQPALQQTLQETRLAAEGARRAMQDLAAVAAPGSPLRTDVNSAVSDLSQAARSLRSFADQVEREPNSLIFGGDKR